MTSALPTFTQKIILGIVLILSLISYSLAQSAPQRIVSLSLCSDQLLLLLADKSKIKSLSYLSANPEFSYLADAAKMFFLNHGQVEEILPLKPDLIITSQFSSSSAVNILQRLGQDVAVLNFPFSIEAGYEQIRVVASLIGEYERGEKLILDMQNSIQHSLTLMPTTLRNKSALFYSPNGYSFGDNTLRNDFLKHLGISNITANIGMNGSGQLSLEALIQHKPDYLLVDKTRSHSQDLSHPMMKHPALQKVFNEGTIITIPDILFQCAGPSITQAFTLMEATFNSKIEVGKLDE